jgi:ectoine hydroxylase-related dioxygenase (phytanoyl-CoA dioxygenase family)
MQNKLMNSPRFVDGNYTKADFSTAIEKNGFAVVENILDEGFILEVKTELKNAISKESAFHGTTSHKDYGMLLACPMYGGAFLKLTENKKLMEPFNWILGDTSIIYVYTSSSMPPNASNYSARIHVDRPQFIPGYTEALGSIILLDDFTEENGATWVLPGSHQRQEAPDENYFYKNAIRIIAPKGSVFYFHQRLWHAGGYNKTTEWRHSLGIGMVRGYLKQRIDLPRALTNTNLSGISDYGLQKLGFFSQPPVSLEEFYAPVEKRTYRQKSEWDNSRE